MALTDTTNKKSKAYLPSIHFNGDQSLHKKLKKRVDDYFLSVGKPRTATTSMYVKTAFVLAAFVISYILLVFQADSIWEGGILSILLGFSAAGIGMNIQHDASHGAYSRNPRVNRLFSMTLDLIGGSSYMWQWKHVKFHHSFVNIPDYDTDIDLGHLAHITPKQKKHWFHRWQQVYMWPLYSLLAIKWQFYDDFSSLIFGRLGRHKIPRPRGMELLVFILGKAIFFSIAFVIPLMVRTPLQVITFYILTALTAGIVLSLIFILPHTVEQSDFPVPSNNTVSFSRDEHQIRVTADFGRGHPMFTWLVGGLNYHREHHLFPGICHVHTPHLAGMLDEECDKAGINHVEHASFPTGMSSHYRFLKRMGRE
ncbi:MAG: fatty acid desaturase family protein [Chitinivibrionales bacterium]